MNSLNTALRAPVLAVSLALLVSPVTSAIARADEGVPRESVRYGDLDLATASGQAMLESRIRVASGQVCVDGDRRNLVAARDARSCREASYARGMAEADTLFAAATKTAAAGAAVTCKAVPDAAAAKRDLC